MSEQKKGQVLGEFMAVLRRWEHQRGYDPRRTNRYFHLVTSRMRIEYPTLAVIGVVTLYTEDMDDGMTYVTVKVVGPFASPQRSSSPPAAC